MKYRKILGADLAVSEICLGTMTFGSPVDEKTATDIVHAAIARGINLIDTANIYEGYQRFAGSPGGAAETILGNALKEKRREVVLMTKVGNPVGSRPENKGLSKIHILTEIEKSLTRLKTDRIDIYFLHRPDPETPLEETLTALQELIKSGKIRYYGISNFSAEQTTQILSLSDSLGLPRPIVSQPPYSLLRREIEGSELPLYIKERISVIAYQPLQGGLLTGKYQRGLPLPANSRKAEKPNWVWELDETLFDRLKAIQRLADDAHVSMRHYALSWVLAQPNVISLVVGVKSVSQLKENIHVVE